MFRNRKIVVIEKGRDCVSSVPNSGMSRKKFGSCIPLSDPSYFASLLPINFLHLE